MGHFFGQKTYKGLLMHCFNYQERLFLEDIFLDIYCDIISARLFAKS
jgi:hypothetical protein